MGNTEPEPVSNANGVEAALHDFIAHLDDDLPPGPPSELGSDDSRDLFLKNCTEADFRQRVAVGKAAINARLDDIKTRQQEK